MKIKRTAPDAFSIDELTSSELFAILTTIERSVNPATEGFPTDFMQNLHESLCSARERMMQRERTKKN